MILGDLRFNSSILINVTLVKYHVIDTVLHLVNHEMVYIKNLIGKNNESEINNEKTDRK